MKKRTLSFIIATLMAVFVVKAKTVIVYYSFTNNVHTIVNDLSGQIEADVVRIQPAEKGIDYAANGYAVGSALISAIRNNPQSASSYPAIDPVEIHLDQYDTIIIATPLWWSNMAAPMQSFLFQHGTSMAGKHIALIVSSASSGISGVVADAKRLIPQGDFIEPNLWIRSSQIANCHHLTSQWLNDIDYTTIASGISAVGKEDDVKIEVTPRGINLVGEHGPAAIYRADGRKVSTITREEASATLQSGCYIVRFRSKSGLSAAKVLIP